VAFPLHVRPYQRPAGVQEYEKDHGWTVVQVPDANRINWRNPLGHTRFVAACRNVSSRAALSTLVQSALRAIAGAARRVGYAAASEQLIDTAVAVPCAALSVEVLTGVRAANPSPR
jgi:hypothetical protein